MLPNPQPIRVRVLGSLDLSTRVPRLWNGDRTQSIALRGFTRTMWQAFEHGQRASLTGVLHIANDNTASLTIQSIAKI